MKQPNKRRSLLFFLPVLLALLLGTSTQAQETPPAPAPAVSAPAPTAAAAPGAPPAAPKIDKGDNAWMLTSSALVLMMTIPGLFLFYGGLVRSKNVLGTIMHSFILVGVVYDRGHHRKRYRTNEIQDCPKGNSLVCPWKLKSILRRQP